MIPTLETLRRAGEILKEIESLQKELTGLFGSSPASAAAAAAPGKRRGRPPGKRRTMSAEARARIAAAAKERWARYRADKKGSGK